MKRGPWVATFLGREPGLHRRCWIAKRAEFVVDGAGDVVVVFCDEAAVGAAEGGDWVGRKVG